ncbi:uncharacterized protein LOC111637431 [Centruroides sculpturatus]|uniref:uncharacterized protein LOC111637431 n=1 Tax=Centruroides sculpturatus TaxID=218467 RepID=UPI000C6DE1CE|nr:uncharacterized protein LOC111637431 [Centruroides sculpturatus]
MTAFKPVDSTQDVDQESQGVLPIKILPDIGESHPCPYFRSSNYIIKVESLPKQNIAPVPVPVPVRARPEFGDEEAEELLDSWLEDLNHAVVWETILDLSKDVKLKDYMDKVSDNPKHYVLTEQRVKNFREKLRKQSWKKDWSVKCDKPMDNLNLEVLIYQAYRLKECEETLDNYAYKELNNECFQKSGIQRLTEAYDQQLEREWKKIDANETKSQPPRQAFKN